tara:strand:+ start:895 stop:2262 length:1368 start_codon:yes stop_codon:yes gene_type:complete
MDFKWILGFMLGGSVLSVFGQKIILDFDQVISIEEKAHHISPIHLNDDGITDLIILTNDFSEAKIFLGNFDGSFDPVSPVTKNENYRLLEAADLDKDGFHDLIFSSYWNNGFKLFWGSESGTFLEGQHFGLTGHGRGIKVYDMNNDGIPDIVALSSGSGQPITLHIYHGKEDRSFIRQGVYGSVLDTDRQITIVDKNLDGLPDVMVSSSFPWFVIFYQQPDGRFIPKYWPKEIELPLPSNYLLADLNNDHIVDVVEYYWEGEIRFYEGLEDTLLSEAFIRLPFLPGVTRFYTVDMNQDGFLDLVTNKYNELTDEPTDTLMVLLNKGDFHFEDPQYFKFPGNITYFNVADVNGDHYPDILSNVENVGLVIAKTMGTGLGYSDPPMLNEYTAFPNPFDSFLKVQADQLEKVEVYTLQGQHIYTSRSGMMETAEWERGIYLIRVITQKGIYWQRTIKQ